MQDNRQIIQRWYKEVWNEERGETIDELIHPEGSFDGLGAEQAVGPAGFRVFYDAFRQQFSDVKVAVDKTYTDGDTVIAKCTVDATHNQTKKTVHFNGVTISTLKDGKLYSGSNHFDFLTMYMQAGKISPEQLA